MLLFFGVCVCVCVPTQCVYVVKGCALCMCCLFLYEASQESLMLTRKEYLVSLYLPYSCVVNSLMDCLGHTEPLENQGLLLSAS